MTVVRRSTTLDFAGPLAIGLLLLAPLVASGLAVRPHARQAAVLMSPRAGLAGAVALAAKADARLVRAGGVPGIWVFASDRDGVSQRLGEAGAWMVFTPDIMGGCLTDRTPT